MTLFLVVFSIKRFESAQVGDGVSCRASECLGVVVSCVALAEGVMIMSRLPMLPVEKKLWVAVISAVWRGDGRGYSSLGRGF